MDEDRIVIAHDRRTFSKEEKVGLLFLTICGLGAMVLGGLYLWRHVASPFSISYTGPRLLLQKEKASAQAEADKKKDTDNDSITDYDEKNIYGTSPYLADTDSDGLSDSTEITNGQDPNCARGKTCNSIVQDENAFRDEGTSGTFVDGLTAPVAPEAPTGLEGGASADTVLSTDDIAELEKLPTSEIRSLLVSSGADPSKVSGMSEDEVRAVYAEILKALRESSEEATAAQTENASGTSNTTP